MQKALREYMGVEPTFRIKTEHAALKAGGTTGFHLLPDLFQEYIKLLCFLQIKVAYLLIKKRILRMLGCTKKRGIHVQELLTSRFKIKKIN